MWACLPAGPLERQFRRGSRGEFEKRFLLNLQEGVGTFLGGLYFGEASASYLIRCGSSGKVAGFLCKFSRPKILKADPARSGPGIAA
jgi:hypothetical protein